MDREKFDQHLMDYLFDEIDEVTRAAMKRQIEADPECREVEARMRATLAVAQRLPALEPSGDLEERILQAAATAERGEPWYRKLSRSLAWAGSHAMQPQLAMAALLVLVLGSSLLFLRARPGAMRSIPEAGLPGKDPATQPVAQDQLPSAPSPPSAADEPDGRERASRRAAPESATSAHAAVADIASDGEKNSADDETYSRGMSNYRAGNYADAERDLRNVSGGTNAANASLYLARAVRAQKAKGCKSALADYERARQLGAGAEATVEEADCYKLLGDEPQANKLLLALSDGKERTVSLDRSGQAAGTSGTAMAVANRAAPQKVAAKAAAKQADAAQASEAPNAAPRAAAAPAKPAAPPKASASY